MTRTPPAASSAVSSRGFAIYDLLEATMDACEHAANVMETISIKNA
jgi:uncharacterized protein Yka (UPF0111/DUF47 family)